MPQSTAALRQKAEALRLLRSPNAKVPVRDLKAPAAPVRTIWARQPFSCHHGQCLALELRTSGLWVKVRDSAGQEGWGPIARILAPGQRRDWARTGF